MDGQVDASMLSSSQCYNLYIDDDDMAIIQLYDFYSKKVVYNNNSYHSIARTNLMTRHDLQSKVFFCITSNSFNCRV